MEKTPAREVKEKEVFVSKNIIVKIGSSTITGESEGVDMDFLSSIAKQVAVLRENNLSVVIVSSGAVACGKRQINGYDGSRIHKQMAASFGQTSLMSRWHEAFAPYGIPVGQILVSNEHLAHASAVIEQISEYGIPIVNANDSVSTYEIDQFDICADNDRLTGYLAKILYADTVLLLSTSCVKDNEGNNVSSILLSDDWQSRITFNGTSGAGTGGMESKHGVALELAALGARVVIADGREENILLNAARGQLVGTTYAL